jgi:hypothetical protein
MELKDPLVRHHVNPRFIKKQCTPEQYEINFKVKANATNNGGHNKQYNKCSSIQNAKRKKKQANFPFDNNFLIIYKF